VNAVYHPLTPQPMPSLLSIVIPAYNEEDVAPLLRQRLAPFLSLLPCPVEVLLVNDGSRDLTLDHFLNWAKQDARVRVIGLARNFGHQAAITAGLDAALVDEVAFDGVDEFLHTCNATTSPWPHEPAVLNYHVTDGRSWRLDFNADGLQVTRITTPDADADLSVTATAAELELCMYGRLPADSLKLDGDRQVLQRLIEWVP